MNFEISRQREYEISLEAGSIDELTMLLDSIDWENDERAEFVGEGIAATEI